MLSAHERRLRQTEPRDWVERQAWDLARVTEQLRQAAAALERGGPAGRARTRQADAAARTVTITLHEARTLLRAIEPHTLTQGGRRGPTARLIAALGEWWRRFQALSLTPPATMLPAAIEAAIGVSDQLGAWTRAMRWHQATTAARQSWPALHTYHSATIDAPDVLTLFDVPLVMVAKPCPTPKQKRLQATIKQPPGQRSLLLPIAGSAEPADAERTASSKAAA